MEETFRSISLGNELKEEKMFSLAKMIKKGLIAIGAFAVPLMLPVVIKLIPGMGSLTIGEVILGGIDRLVPNLTSLTVGAGIIMFINFMKNRK